MYSYTKSSHWDVFTDGIPTSADVPVDNPQSLFFIDKKKALLHLSFSPLYQFLEGGRKGRYVPPLQYMSGLKGILGKYQTGRFLGYLLILNINPLSTR